MERAPASGSSAASRRWSAPGPPPGPRPASAARSAAVGRAAAGGAPHERPVVEAGAPHQDRQPPAASATLVDRRGRLPDEARRVVGLVGLDDVHQVMADGAALRPAWACSSRCPSGGRPGGSRRSPPRSASCAASATAARVFPTPGRADHREERDGRRRGVRRRRHARHQVRRSSRLISPSGIRETMGRPCGQ